MKTALQSCIPVFTLASTTGLGLPILHTFLSHLEPAYQHISSESDSQNRSIAAVSETNGALDVHDDSDCRPPVTSFENLVGDSGKDIPGPGSGGTGKALGAESSSQPQGLHPGGASATLSMQLLDPARRMGREAAGRPGESPPGAPAHFQVDQTFEVRGVGSGAFLASFVTINSWMVYSATFVHITHKCHEKTCAESSGLHSTRCLASLQ